MVDRFAENLLGGHVADGADEDTGFGEGAGDLRAAGEAEVDDLDFVAAVDDEVGWLDVAVDDAMFVRVVQAGKQLRSEGRGGGQFERAASDSAWRGFRRRSSP